MAFLALALAGAQLRVSPVEGAPGGSATGRADVRLIRLLSEVPESFRRSHEPLHDLRVRLVPGNVLVLRKGNEFAALLPIERIGGSPDSLRYFYYVERSPRFWFFGGARSRGIREVADGASLRFNSFRLLWGRSDEGPGWVYFPDALENRHLRFSVVSGRTVDQADPKDTKYWVELGAEGPAGF